MSCGGFVKKPRRDLTPPSQLAAAFSAVLETRTLYLIVAQVNFGTQTFYLLDHRESLSIPNFQFSVFSKLYPALIVKSGPARGIRGSLATRGPQAA